MTSKKDDDIVESWDRKLSKMEATMEQYIDFSQKTIPREILNKLLVQVIPYEGGKFL